MFAVHAPMMRDFNVESLGSERAKERLKLVSQLAANMHQIHHKPVIVVIHQELSAEQLLAYGLIQGIKNTLKELLSEFPMIEFAFENLTPLGIEDGNLITRNSYFDAPVKLASYLRSSLNTNRIGTVLDTCHMLSTIRIANELSCYGPLRQYHIEDFFSLYQDTLKLVHLTNATGFGFGENHGTVFKSEEDIEILKEILNCAIKIEFKNPITLEIVEENHASALLYSEVRDVLMSLGINHF